MSQMTDYMENKLADYLRGQGLTLPTNWYAALGSAAADGSFTELTGTGYARQAVPRSLIEWAGTQGPLSVVASSGSSHLTSNNSAISWGTPGSAWGTAAFIGLFDDPTAGNCWMVVPIPAILITTGNPDPVQVAASALQLTLGISGGLTDTWSNDLIDLIFRAQASAMPSPIYLAVFTTAPTNAGGGAEVSGGSYARVAITPGLTTLSSTQGNSSASSGTGGRVFNLAQLDYPDPTGDWGTILAEGVLDAPTGGTLLLWHTLTAAQSIVNAGPPPSHAVGTFGITLA